MLGNLNGWHAVILLVIILLLFGAPKLPALAKSLGQSMKIFKAEVKQPGQDNDSATNASVSSEQPEEAHEQTPDAQTQHKP